MRVKAVDPQYLSSFPYYARHAQDRLLDEEVFFHKRNGVFVDLGAYDGVESSNTLFFEESRDWGGVCVEPLPDAFEKLKSNRSCLCINACASDSYRRASFLHVIPATRQRLPGEGRTSNYEKMSGLAEFVSSEHEERIQSTLGRVGGTTEQFDVPCVPVNDILRKARSTTIDCLSIDTEGSEFHILRSIDFSLFDIDVIVVEVLSRSETFTQFMKTHGYVRLGEIGYDWVYRKSAYRG